jgi:uncharacterized membrane protein
MGLGVQVVWLVLLAMVVATLSWTVTHEELLREPREYCLRRSQESRRFISRKFFYLLTCEYCFSHYVVAALLAITRFRLLFDDWRGYLIAGLALVWLANVYMSLYANIRLEVKKERVEVKEKEQVVQRLQSDSGPAERRPAA